MLLWVQHYNLPIRFCAAAAIAPIVSIPMTERCRPAKGCRKKMLPKRCHLANKSQTAKQREKEKPPKLGGFSLAAELGFEPRQYESEK